MAINEEIPASQGRAGQQQGRAGQGRAAQGEGEAEAAWPSALTPTSNTRQGSAAQQPTSRDRTEDGGALESYNNRKSAKQIHSL